MATLPVNPISAKRRPRAAASSCAEPNRRSRPEASTTTVPASSSSTRGENSYAQPEAAALPQQVGDFQGVLGFAATADPQQPVERNARGCGGSRIERVVHIHQGAKLFARGGLRQGRKQ